MQTSYLCSTVLCFCLFYEWPLNTAFSVSLFCKMVMHMEQRRMLKLLFLGGCVVVLYADIITANVHTDGVHGNNCQQRRPLNCKKCESNSTTTWCSDCEEAYVLTDSKHCHILSHIAPECRHNSSKCAIACQNGSSYCQRKCKNGYHGGLCLYKCPGNCVRCIDSTIVRVANCTHCKEGYFSTDAQFQCQLSCNSSCRACTSSQQCTSCREGHFLAASKQCHKCHHTCLSCLSGTVCSSCADGNYLSGGQCKPCSRLCHTCSSKDVCICSVGCIGGMCSNSSSKCVFGCKPNFMYGEFRACDACDPGIYGVNCSHVCQNCNPSCHRITGKCPICFSGFYGDHCDKNCPENCSSACYHITGSCTACKESFYGNKCQFKCNDNCKTCNMNDGVCTVCSDGFHGDHCDKRCSDNCVINKCDKDTGGCECVLGFEGDRCDLATTKMTTAIWNQRVFRDERNVTPTAVGLIIGVVLIVIGTLIAAAVTFIKRRPRQRYPQSAIEFDSYKLDPRLIDVLEEDDDFDETYLTLTINDHDKHCGQLPVKELAQFVDTHGEDYFQEEFLKLPRGLIKPCDDAKKDENIVKNRYTGIYPYDEHRVRLLPPGSDFINACYIDGFNKMREYIASLGPTMKAMEQFQLFWRMVWQEKTDVIVMVTNLNEGQAMKCEQYWPENGTSSTYGDITVTSQQEYVYAEFVVKTFIITRYGEQRELHHVHYTAWPDKRVPDDITSLIEFRQKVKSIKPVLGGPTIVHCSAGIGRTGTYIALDILINQGKAQKALDIFDCVTRMREQRTSMVQTWQQYEYLHNALVHALTYHCEPIKAKTFEKFMNTAKDKKMTHLFKQLQRKKERQGESELEARQMNTELEGVNRDGADIPGNMHRPVLRLDKICGVGTYINAIFVNSFTVKNRFIIAQTPLPETVKDFLTLICQENCSCIVSLDSPGLEDHTRGEYFSVINGGVYVNLSYVFEVKTQELDSNPSYILRRLTINVNKKSGSTSRTVYHYQCHHWPQENRVPNISPFLQLVQDVEAIVDRNTYHGPILVHCMNGAERSGLFCAVSNIIQKMRLGGEVSVVNTLRQIKVRRPLVIPNKEQYIFCYQCLKMYLNPEVGDHGVTV